jgi:hypothetical protein
VSERRVEEAAPAREVIKPASLLNHDSCTEDDAIVDTFPVEPVYAKPCESDGSLRSPEIVELAVEKKPERPRTVVVEL